MWLFPIQCHLNLTSIKTYISHYELKENLKEHIVCKNYPYYYEKNTFAFEIHFSINVVFNFNAWL